MTTLPDGTDLSVAPGSARHPGTPKRATCAVCHRPLHEFPHATFELHTETHEGEYHGEVRNFANGFADVYVFGYGEFHVQVSRLNLTDAAS